MKRICVITSTRADYGLLKGVMKEISESASSELQIIATGMHTSPHYGLTSREIEADGFHIDETVIMDLEDDSSYGIIRSMGRELVLFADKYQELKPDIVLLLGDRYEILIAATAAMMASIPIAHLCGGELTVGAIDDTIRHCITKMSYLHFASAEEYRDRIIQLGEAPDRVYCFGDTGVENILKLRLLEKKKLEEEIGFSLKNPYALVTFHPVTLEKATAEEQFGSLLSVLEGMDGRLNLIFTKANSDAGGQAINRMIDHYVEDHPETSVAFTSMGQMRYLSAMKYSAAVIGNSSSGIVEAPAFGIPSVNIGDRQKGRLKASSIIDCEPTADSIRRAIETSLLEQFKERICTEDNPYQGANVAQNIVSTIEDFLSCGRIKMKKEFYDLRSNES